MKSLSLEEFLAHARAQPPEISTYIESEAVRRLEALGTEQNERIAELETELEEADNEAASLRKKLEKIETAINEED